MIKFVSGMVRGISRTPTEESQSLLIFCFIALVCSSRLIFALLTLPHSYYDVVRVIIVAFVSFRPWIRVRDLK